MAEMAGYKNLEAGSSAPVTSKTKPAMLVAQYVFAFACPIVYPWAVGFGVLPMWVLYSYLAGMVFCYFAWEMWVTWGLAGGKSFMVREPNQFPILNGNAMNCILMSSMDSLVLQLMLFFALWHPITPANWEAVLSDGFLNAVYARGPDMFSRWRLVPFIYFFAIGYGQGVGVALGHRSKDKEAQMPTLENNALSWAPLIPTLPLTHDPLIGGLLYNFTARIMLPWLAMPLLFQAMLIYVIFETPLPTSPLATLLISWVTLCFYLVFFASTFPKCGSTTPDGLGNTYPVPSFPSTGTAPATTWKDLLLGVLAGWSSMAAAFGVSYGLLYMIG